MRTVDIGELGTLILAILAILLGDVLNRLLPRLKAANIPPAVSGGLTLAVVVALVHSLAGVELHFATGNRNVLLLVFFIGLGLAAKFSGLRRGGVQVAMMCGVIAGTVFAQNAVGAMIAKAFGLPPAEGLFVGSISFLGGHGTAAAWAQSPQAAGLPSAFEIGIAAATLGLIAGGLVAGPVATWLARSSSPVAARPDSEAIAPEPEADPGDGLADILSSDRWLRVLLLIAAAMAIGEALQWLAALRGITVPAFLTAMFGGIVLTNLADVVRRPVDFHLADLVSTVALRLFLAMSMLGLKLLALADFAGLLAAAVVIQVVVIVLLAGLVVYPMMGRNREAAIAAGGYIGFGMGAMPVGLGTMRRLAEVLGPAPQAFLVVTLAASLFTDTANALGISLFFDALK